jgi:hypothetical protein
LGKTFFADMEKKRRDRPRESESERDLLDHEASTNVTRVYKVKS